MNELEQEMQTFSRPRRTPHIESVHSKSYDTFGLPLSAVKWLQGTNWTPSAATKDIAEEKDEMEDDTDTSLPEESWSLCRQSLSEAESAFARFTNTQDIWDAVRAFMCCQTFSRREQLKDTLQYLRTHAVVRRSKWDVEPHHEDYLGQRVARTAGLVDAGSGQPLLDRPSFVRALHFGSQCGILDVVAMLDQCVQVRQLAVTSKAFCALFNPHWMAEFHELIALPTAALGPDYRDNLELTILEDDLLDQVPRAIADSDVNYQALWRVRKLVFPSTNLPRDFPFNNRHLSNLTHLAVPIGSYVTPDNVFTLAPQLNMVVFLFPHAMQTMEMKEEHDRIVWMHAFENRCLLAFKTTLYVPEEEYTGRTREWEKEEGARGRTYHDVPEDYLGYTEKWVNGIQGFDRAEVFYDIPEDDTRYAQKWEGIGDDVTEEMRGLDAWSEEKMRCDVPGDRTGGYVQKWEEEIRGLDLWSKAAIHTIDSLRERLHTLKFGALDGDLLRNYVEYFNRHLATEFFGGMEDTPLSLVRELTIDPLHDNVLGVDAMINHLPNIEKLGISSLRSTQLFGPNTNLDEAFSQSRCPLYLTLLTFDNSAFGVGYPSTSLARRVTRLTLPRGFQWNRNIFRGFSSLTHLAMHVEDVTPDVLRDGEAHLLECLDVTVSPYIQTGELSRWVQELYLSREHCLQMHVCLHKCD